MSLVMEGRFVVDQATVDQVIMGHHLRSESDFVDDGVLGCFDNRDGGKGGVGLINGSNGGGGGESGGSAETWRNR